MTTEEYKCLELPLADDKKLYVESGLEWIQDNTTLIFDIADIKSVKALPSGAKLFLIKYCEITEKHQTVTSESMGPMSQSYSTKDVDCQIYAIARQLLKKYLKPNVCFVPCKKRWR